MSWVLSVLSYLPQPLKNYIMDMRIPEIKNSPEKVQFTRLGHVYFEHPDLKKFETFASDFGFTEAKRVGNTIYYRGYGKDQYIYVASQSNTKEPKFNGAAFVVEKQEEWEKALKIPGGTVKTLDDAPGGGQLLTFARPNGTFAHILYGQEEREVGNEIPTATEVDTGPFNDPVNKPRKNQFQRFKEGPALIHKLGHFGYVCKEFDEELNFYTSNFNIVPSDVLYHPQFHNMDVITFMHLDLGKDYSDHHSMFLQRAPPEVQRTYIHHSSYEIADIDTQYLGHYWLAKKGWESVWGVGRHILGSQIFDYWKDSSGFKIEHYADGDVVNNEIPTKRDVAGPISVWGPELPKDFADDTTIKIPH